jgi:hypothetical protein
VEQLSQVIDFVEKGDPAIVVGVVLANVLGCVEVAQLVGLGVVHALLLGQLLGLLGTRGWDSSSHFNNYLV